jgi:hypothetical protein
MSSDVGGVMALNWLAGLLQQNLAGRKSILNFFLRSAKKKRISLRVA